MSLDPGMQQSGNSSNHGAKAFGRGLAGSGRHQHLTLPQMAAKYAEQTPAFVISSGSTIIGHGSHLALASLKLPAVDKVGLRASGEILKPFAKLALKLATAGRLG